jgi:hypothetical protein
MNSLGEHERSVAVSEVVKADARVSGLVCERREAMREVVRDPRAAIPPIQDEI